MLTVNPYLIHQLMAPLTGLADDDEAVVFYDYVNPSNEEHYRAIISELIVKYFSNLSDAKKERTKFALKYYLSKKDSDFDSAFDACLPPFEPPDNTRNFYVWIWEEIYGNEYFEITDMDKYKVVPNMYE